MIAVTEIGNPTWSWSTCLVGYHTWKHTPTLRGFDTWLGYYNADEDYFDHSCGGGGCKGGNNSYFLKSYLRT